MGDERVVCLDSVQKTTDASGHPDGEHHLHMAHRQSSASMHRSARETLHAMSMDLSDGSRQINQYHILYPIGQGSYAKVHIGEFTEHGDTVKVAIKEFGKMRLRRNLRMRQHRAGVWAPHAGETAREVPTDPLYLIRTEVAIMKKLAHPNVLHLYEVLDDPDAEKLYMVCEYCSDGPLIAITGGKTTEPLPEANARTYFAQVLSGIDYLHTNGIVHRDIKPDNILLADGRRTCKIVDFGVSEMFCMPGDDTMTRGVGSPAFMSPALCEAAHGTTHGCPDDLWALGVTLYCMVVGRLPFYNDDFMALHHSILHDAPELDPSLSPELRDLLTRMLDKDENTRITIPELYRHPWVTQHDTISIPTLEEIGKAYVEDITEEDLHTAICRISSVFAVARAISRFKRRSTLHHRDTDDSGSRSSSLLSAQHRKTSLTTPVSSDSDSARVFVDSPRINGDTIASPTSMHAQLEPLPDCVPEALAVTAGGIVDSPVGSPTASATAALPTDQESENMVVFCSSPT
ncbi:non-specific serine/threonine protein kinase [Malassezia sp. CBS 17886]|nr:non-specific serine/threonine protein kinase [Malassezia sp. CBS 17886]